MRIVFFGTGEFSTTVLKGLVDANHNIVGVVTQPDKVNGRNGKVTYSQIKQYCLTQNIPIFQFAKLNLEGEQSLKELDADLFITASYGQIIKQNILNIPRFGIYNVHGSLLPKYRGPAPIQWAIINGERTTGITIMKTELGVDCGEKYGNVYANLMGGYSTSKGGVIYVHGKKEDGSDDWENSFTVDWDDRNNDDILDEIGDFQ